MAKKKTKSHSKRLDAADFGIDLDAVLTEISEHIDGDYETIGKKAGNMPAGSVSNVVNGHRKPSLAVVAALAHATGGRLVVKYEPPKKR